MCFGAFVVTLEVKAGNLSQYHFPPQWLLCLWLWVLRKSRCPLRTTEISSLLCKFLLRYLCLWSFLKFWYWSKTIGGGISSVSVAQLCLTLCEPMDCSTPGLPIHHQLPEFTQSHVHWVGEVIQPSHPLSSPSPPALNLSQHQGLFKWVSSSHEVAKVLEFQLQHQSFQWTFKTDFL